MQSKIYFSEIFEVDKDVLSKCGAFNISLINDLPLFIDPFLLFNSKIKIYNKLHSDIITYLLYLKQIAQNELTDSVIQHYFTFKEVKQTWLGFSMSGNSGRGLGNVFAKNLNSSFVKYLSNFGFEEHSKTHLEKVCLFDTGIGKDCISDFTTNLILGYLAEYTEKFSLENINKKYLVETRIRKYKFNYQTKSWEEKLFWLPYYKNDYVLLTPKNILTKDEPWINEKDRLDYFPLILNSIGNSGLRVQVNSYFNSILQKDDKGKVKSKDRNEAIFKTFSEFPELNDLYIYEKEKNSEKATKLNKKNLAETKEIFYDAVIEIVTKLLKETNFYKNQSEQSSFDDIKNRVLFFKDWVENKDGWKELNKKGEKITASEKTLQILFKLVWYGTKFDINSEPNNGGGPVDFKTSFGSGDKAIVEFKLGSNSKLKKNLSPLGQVRAYEKANGTKMSLKVIFCYTVEEITKTKNIINEFKINDNQVIIIDCRQKKSASNIDPLYLDDFTLEELKLPSFEELNFDFQAINLSDN